MLGMPSDCLSPVSWIIIDSEISISQIIRQQYKTEEEKDTS